MIIQESVDLDRFIKRMSEAVSEAGEVARTMQGKVKNLAKKIEHEEGLSEVEKYIRSAQTEVDIKSQEILIKSAREVLDEETSLDAEEDSPSVCMFNNSDKDLTLVLDPIDGTAEYLSNKDEYSICVGLILKGQALAALVYYPNFDLLYYIDSEGKGRIDKDHSKSKFKNSSKIVLSPSNTNKIYVGNFSEKVRSEEVKQKLIKAGYAVKTALELQIGDSEILRKLITGEGGAFIVYSTQVRDLLIGAVIQASENGYAAALSGNELNWPQGGVVKEAIFGAEYTKVKLSEALN